MLELSMDEIEAVFGGNGTPPPPPPPTTTPTCTTNGSTTTCTCPSGYQLAAGAYGNVALISCVRPRT